MNAPESVQPDAPEEPQAAPAFCTVPSGATWRQFVALEARPFTWKFPFINWFPILVEVAPADPTRVMPFTENSDDGEVVPIPEN